MRFIFPLAEKRASVKSICEAGPAWDGEPLCFRQCPWKETNPFPSLSPTLSTIKHLRVLESFPHEAQTSGPAPLCFSSFLPSAPAPFQKPLELQVSAVWVSPYLALSHDTHISNQESQFLFSSPWFSQTVDDNNSFHKLFTKNWNSLKNLFLLQTSLSFTYPSPRWKWISSIAMLPKTATAFLVCRYNSTPAHAGSSGAGPQLSSVDVIPPMLSFPLYHQPQNSFLICTHYYIWPFFSCWHFLVMNIYIHIIANI